MAWLSYTEDEVTRFHLQFESASNEALRNASLDGQLAWVHHLRSPGNPLVPDFVLRRRDGNQWLLALEIKRRKESVFSTRNQIQAKSYAEANQDLYPPNFPRYFAISNLEATILFALNLERPPNECRLRDGMFESGNFTTDDIVIHRSRFIAHLECILEIITNDMRPEFDLVWPSVLAEFWSNAVKLPRVPEIFLSEPNTLNWHLVRDYFCKSLPDDSAMMFILRCLMTEYIRGILIRYGHPRAGDIPPLRADHPSSSLANIVECLSEIDFTNFFDHSAATVYRNLVNIIVSNQLHDYIEQITDPNRRICELAMTRVDSAELLDSLMTTIYPVEIQDDRGKVTTDPELASLLCYLTISSQVRQVLDPCCGDGVLLSAAYDRLRTLGMSHANALTSIKGIEADYIAVGLANIRLALKQPSTISPNAEISLVHGDMFAFADTFAEAEVIIMNPPFKRYEAQDIRPVPPELRRHFSQAIRAIDGTASRATGGQANLFNYYVEFVAKAIPAGAKIGVILDNKWYHNIYGKALRQVLLGDFEIEAIIEYPHSAFFSHWTITTSILIAKKTQDITPGHNVRFVRCKVDPRAVDLNALSNAFQGNGPWPIDWTCLNVPQEELDPRVGWKSYFSDPLTKDFRRQDWPNLDQLFRQSRRGSLQKEGGGISVFEFPFHRSEYGPRRRAVHPRRRYQTGIDRELSAEDNRILGLLAREIPADFRGWAIRNSDDLEHYELTVSDVEKHETLEPPRLRAQYQIYLRNRARWTIHHDLALEDMRNDPQTKDYISAIEDIVNLTEDVLPKDELWNVLREPTAGELIIPRKTRRGHRVHLNPFAFDSNSKQVRMSSNFISYRDCLAVDRDSGLDRPTAARLIMAFLVSSFGQLQFEMEGYNREGLLAVEKELLARVRIFDPRWIRQDRRIQILNSFSQLPFPISADRLSVTQQQRNHLDTLFAEEIVSRYPDYNLQELIEEVHNTLDEWITSRQP